MTESPSRPGQHEQRSRQRAGKWLNARRLQIFFALAPTVYGNRRQWSRGVSNPLFCQAAVPEPVRGVAHAPLVAVTVGTRIAPWIQPIVAPRIMREMPVGSEWRSHRSSDDTTPSSRRIDLDRHPQRGNRKGNRAPRGVFPLPCIHFSVRSRPTRTPLGVRVLRSNVNQRRDLLNQCVGRRSLPPASIRRCRQDAQ